MSVHNARQYSEFKGINLKKENGVLRFEDANTAPTTTSGEYCLFVDGGVLKFDNGSSVSSLSSATTSVPTWETIYAGDATFSLTSAAWTITQSANVGTLIVTKTGTGAGVPLTINNAGTGYDLSIVTTNAEAAGVEIFCNADWGNGSNADVPFTLSVNGNSNNGTSREFANVKFTATDAGNSSEDCTMTVDTMVAGTSRTIFTLLNTGLAVGYGSAATFKSQGNYDVILSTGNSTTGTITITDGTDGEIAIAPNGAGVATVSTGLQTGGTTPTACIFNVAGSTGSGTTGYGLKVNASTMTSGTVLEVDSASSSSGLLFDFQLATTSVLKMTEAGLITAAGTAASNTLDITAGDVRLQDGSITVTDADDAGSLTVTNNSCVGGASLIGFAGSGTYTGTTTKSFMNITPSGLTTGTAVYLPLAAITTGKGLHITSGTTITQGSLVYVQTTGAAVAATSANIVYFNETATAANANRSGSTVYISSDRTVAGGTTADDFDTLSVIKATTRSSGTAATAGSAIYAEIQCTGTVTETSNGIEVVMDSGGTGLGVSITHNATGGRALGITSSATTKDGVLQLTAAAATTGKLLVIDADALTEGYLAELSVAGAALTTGSPLYVNHTSGNITATVNCTSAGLGYITSARTVTSGTVADDFDLVGLVRSSTINGAGAFTAAGSVLKLTNTVTNTSGTVADTTIGLEVSMSANGTGTGVSVTHAAASATGILSLNNALTTGKLISATSTGTGTTSGCLFYGSSATAGAVATNGLVSLNASGAYTSATSAGALLYVNASATTAGYVATINGAALTNGYALTVVGAGAYTGTGFVTVTPSGLTSGAGVSITTAALTSGKALSVTLGTTTTSGNGLYIYDNSADVTERGLIYIVSDNTAATGSCPILIKNDSVNSTNYRRLIKESNSGITIWMGNGNGANGVLSGTAGDILINGASNKPEYCTGTTNWTALV